MTLNIGKNDEDIFYRYKMPSPIVKIEGKGNGVKTVFVNMMVISKALNRPPSLLLKYFCYELCIQARHDCKSGRYIFSGYHNSQKIQEILNNFIDAFVLCSTCRNPETSLIKKKSRILQYCSACGITNALTQNHRLITYIVNHTK